MKVFISSLFWIFFYTLLAQANPLSPPKPSCTERCHVDVSARSALIYQAPECSVCHGRMEEHLAALKNPSPKSSSHANTGYPVPNQSKALMRLKGRRMRLPASRTTHFPGMVYIPAGEFIMGSNDRWEDEAPEHVLYLPAFFIDKYEVTNEQYRWFVHFSGHPAPRHWKNNTYPPGRAKYPVTYVSWEDATAYAKWAGKRLPSEEEWEKAARGTDGRTYPWGMEFDPAKSNNPQKGSKGIEPVGSYQVGRSPYGLYGMSGNVWEWVDAWYLPHRGNSKPSGEYGYKYKISKGGSWYNCLFYNCGISAPVYNRAFLLPSTKNSSLGFRCVKDVTR